ncbi:hypothetical protein NE236_10790 [Actinoallomurus purpureus]|uniref:hypothetical protein n=1 Tax=Actinoallomurus purpureus TaxID=478114 RepID=UPI0020939E2C|nr:hypothetical protein [Actinoallomurus purpureus]MCO6005469.1 hypothetical protein [Actinoallomurus purpureus]
MNASPEPEHHLPPAAQEHLERLAAALRARGFTVTVTPPALAVRNPDTDATHATVSNGLAQAVLLREDAGRWVWCWVWPGLRPARRGDPVPPPEIEPIGPAEDIAETARLIAKVIRIDEPTGTPR